jgi:hypothetical protein
MVSQADDGNRIREQIVKYVGAIAHFKRYESGPMSDLWDDAHADGFSYWRIMPCDQQDLMDVSRQAREGFESAVEGGLTPETLALGLGRALTRFKIVKDFKAFVEPMVSAMMAQLGRVGRIEEPATGPSRQYLAACRDEVMRGSVRELQKYGLIASSFEWIAQAPAAKPSADTSEVPGDDDLPLSGRNRTGLSSPTSPVTSERNAEEAASSEGARGYPSRWRSPEAAASGLGGPSSPQSLAAGRPSMRMWTPSLSKPDDEETGGQ